MYQVNLEIDSHRNEDHSHSKEVPILCLYRRKFSAAGVDHFLTHFFAVTHFLTQNRVSASGMGTPMWVMSFQNSQQTPPKTAQWDYLLRLTTAHNPKGERVPVALCREQTEATAETVGSNPAPATKDPRFY